MKKAAAIVLSFILLLCAGCSSDSSLKLGAAEVGGMYAEFANVLAQVAEKEDVNVQLNVKSTAGSLANVRLLSEGYLQLGISQEDLVNAAYYGEDDYKDNQMTGYSAVADLFLEACQIIVRADSEIQSVDDLFGKKVSIGGEESGTERNANQILQIYGLTKNQVTCKNYGYTDGAKALISGEIDAMFVTSGTKTNVVEEIARQCDIRLISLDEEHIEKLQKSFSFYNSCTIPAGTYSGQDEDVNTVGVHAILLANNSLSSETVKKLTAALFEYADEFQYSLPINLELEEEEATKDVTIPFHKGAAAYYETKGITVEQ